MVLPQVEGDTDTMAQEELRAIAPPQCIPTSWLEIDITTLLFVPQIYLMTTAQWTTYSPHVGVTASPGASEEEVGRRSSVGIVLIVLLATEESLY